MKRKLGTAGFTIVELMVATAVGAFLSLWIVDWLGKPAIIQRQMMAVDRQKLLVSASSAMLNDLQEADPSSIPWTDLPPDGPGTANGISFWKLSYDLVNPGSVSQTKIQYQFQPDGNGTGALVRIVSQGAVAISTTIVLSPLDIPGVNETPPLVQAEKTDPTDADYSILIVSMRYHPLGSPPISVLRRITIAL